MELADLVHRHISGRAPAHALLAVYNQVEDGKMLSEIHNLIIEKYDYSPHEALTEMYNVDELYALSSTENYLRNPTQKNLKKRNEYYKEIGYRVRISLSSNA